MLLESISIAAVPVEPVTSNWYARSAGGRLGDGKLIPVVNPVKRQLRITTGVVTAPAADNPVDAVPAVDEKVRFCKVGCAAPVVSTSKGTELVAVVMRGLVPEALSPCDVW